MLLLIRSQVHHLRKIWQDYVFLHPSPTICMKKPINLPRISLPADYLNKVSYYGQTIFLFSILLFFFNDNFENTVKAAE